MRDIWRSEAHDFTPWLAREDNIAILGDTLSMELEVEAEESNVGPFRADILCKDLVDNSWVLIENQLERTDHTHLGQLLTYAAGLQTVTIIWVAARFTEEHRAALDWLNEITDERFRFFGVEVELWRIGDSAAAPKFNVISKPNEWSRSVSQASRRLENEPVTETKQMQLDFWTELQGRLEGHRTLRSRRPRPQHWTTYSIGRSGMHLAGLFNTRDNRVGVELYLGDDNANAYFQQLELQRPAIEAELGFVPLWKALPERRACRIIVYLENIDPADRSRWPEYHSWMVRTLEAFSRVFKDRVARLEIAPPDGEM
ncbi:DUF4268 domain-containing protein [Pelagibacterium luteolum]|uniref:DUF4268 domain-containing protein n=1 Tax=Pelagibacterium luteolum TaxID=440168 RepID=UPI001FCD5AD1|nr:DUF4268 domain-containing protein [Pelagibacterium luteolum]